MCNVLEMGSQHESQELGSMTRRSVPKERGEPLVQLLLCITSRTSLTQTPFGKNASSYRQSRATVVVSCAGYCCYPWTPFAAPLPLLLSTATFTSSLNCHLHFLSPDALLLLTHTPSDDTLHATLLLQHYPILQYHLSYAIICKTIQWRR